MDNVTDRVRLGPEIKLVNVARGTETCTRNGLVGEHNRQPVMLEKINPCKKRKRIAMIGVS